MPTGYTSIINDNPDTTLREYLLRCVRSRTGAVLQRDEPLSAPLKTDYSPGEYWTEEIAHLEHLLEEMDGTPKSEIENIHREAVRQAGNENRERWERYRIEDDAYLRMRCEVQAWDPPPEYADLKLFALEQISTGRPVKPWVQEVNPDAEEWWSELKQTRAEQLERARTQKVKEERGCHERNAYLKGFLESLPEPEGKEHPK